MKTLLRKLFYQLSQSRLIYKVAKRLTFDHRGENNCDINTNGEMQVLKAYIKPQSVIFDVGANVGDWTRTVLDISSEVEVHSFEPSKHTYKTLSSHKWPAGVHTNNLGLGSAAGEATFFVHGEGSTLNSIYFRDAIFDKETVKTETVSMQTLDAYCEEHGISAINFLKIDVEGHELEVLKGSSAMLATNKIDLIQFEYGGTYIDAGYLLKDVVEYMASYDYGLYKIMHNRIEHVAYEKDLENFQYCNYLFIKHTEGE